MNVEAGLPKGFFCFSGSPGLNRRDLAPILAIFIYCACYAVLRLLVSHSMELDEAEQFVNAASFHLGYPRQAPLYTWLVWLVSLFTGRGLAMLVLVKYSLLFVFYVSFYLLARHFQGPGGSLLATGSLLLFPLFAYEANRDLSNTVLVSAMAVIACLFFLRLLMGGSRLDYLAYGVSCGLGMLSKYNFIFFLLAMLLYGATSESGRRALLRKKTLLCALGFAGILFPHAVWLAGHGFRSVRYACNLSRPGGPKTRSFAHFLAAVYLEAVLALLVFALFMGRYLPVRAVPGARKEAHPSPAGVFPPLAFFSLAIPLLGIIVFNPAHFQSRWLAPVYFTIPLAGFSLAGERLPRSRRMVLGYLCLAVAVLVFAARAVIGFFPDVTGKRERIHIPYAALSRQLASQARRAGAGTGGGFPLPVTARSADSYVAANIVADLPGARYVPMREALRHPEIFREGGIFISTPGGETGAPRSFYPGLFPAARKETLRAAYLHSRKPPPYTLEALIIAPLGKAGRRGEKAE